MTAPGDGDDASGLPILTATIWLPIIGGIAVLASGDKDPGVSKWTALAFAVLTFLVSMPLWTGFDISTPEMQFVERASWIPTFHVEYYLGIDGISMPLILLTTFITIFVIVAGWEVIPTSHRSTWPRSSSWRA